ncbi:MAG TPA: GGDEF domain-containing protein [Gemmatimonadaceae bacterium]|nr:GGDEF domain-containing protein [Gemmatimonadaceae bacterium]
MIPPLEGERPEPRLSAFFSPITDPGADSPSESVTGALGVQLRREEAESHREVLIAQRWARVAIAVALAFIAQATAGFTLPWMVVAVPLGGYAALVLGLSFLTRLAAHGSAPIVRIAVIATMGADLILAAVLMDAVPAAAGIVRLTGLLLVLHAAWFLDGRYAAAAIAGIAIAILSTRTEAGGWMLVVAHAITFVGVAATMTWLVSRQREFFAELRLFCRQVARGDIGVRLLLAATRSGDPAVRLAREVDSMRKGLAEQIGVDALTGCLNRRALESRLRGEWRLARRRRSSVAVAAIDIDHFKQINDSHGHAAGDAVLQRLAAIMKSIARESDAVARLGGDEFVLILPDTDGEGARIVTERLRERVAGTPFGPPLAPIQVTISMGAVALRGTDDLAPSDVLAQADRALYSSKQAGRNRVSFA